MAEMYIKMRGKQPIAYAYGDEAAAMALFVDDVGYDTPEQAKAAWKKQNRETPQSVRKESVDRPCGECIWHTGIGCSSWNCDPITRAEARRLIAKAFEDVTKKEAKREKIDENMRLIEVEALLREELNNVAELRRAMTPEEEDEAEAAIEYAQSVLRNVREARGI